MKHFMTFINSDKGFKCGKIVGLFHPFPDSACQEDRLVRVPKAFGDNRSNLSKSFSAR